jgi:hypothetical protein
MAATWAMPLPIVPAPQTQMVCIILFDELVFYLIILL